MKTQLEITQENLDKLIELNNSIGTVESIFYAMDKTVNSLHYICEELWNSFKIFNDKNSYRRIKQQFNIFLMALECLMNYHEEGKKELGKYTDLLTDMVSEADEKHQEELDKKYIRIAGTDIEESNDMGGGLLN